MSKADVDILIDNRFPNNTQQLIKPVDARIVTKRLNEETFNLDDNDSDDIQEGTTNLFFTDERVDDRMAQVLQPSVGGDITWDYDDTAGTITPVFSGTGGGGGGGVEVTDVDDRNALKLGTNFENPDSPSDTYYMIMTQNIPTGYSEHAYYLGYNTENGGRDFYEFVYQKIDSSFFWVRKIIAFGVPNI
jgi:hypothetical protein